MNEEEPAWRAELKESIHRYFDEVEGGSIWYLTGRLMEALVPHIQAAEQRGREAALREAAQKIRAYVDTRGNVDLMRIFWRGAANYIDPDKP